MVVSVPTLTQALHFFFSIEATEEKYLKKKCWPKDGSLWPDINLSSVSKN